MKILIIPRTLGYGGAQSQAIALASELARREHDICLMPFYGGGQLERELGGARLHLINVNKRSRWDLHRVVWKLCQTMGQERFDAIYSLGAGPNLVATLVRFCFPSTILFWSVRKSDMLMLEHESPSDFGWLCAKMARFSDRIIFNSRRGLEHGIECGYPRSKVICIPNGINTDVFYPDPVEGGKLRSEWHIGVDEKLIGIVGRIDPVKNHDDFLHAAALVASERSDVRFACVGGGSASLRSGLQSLSRELHIEDKVLWVEPRRDMRAVYNALDILCSASLSEGFPNAVGEALACACACVVTDVGDCRFLVGEAGRVVQPGDAGALARELVAELTSGNGRNDRGRQRVVENFDVCRLGDGFEEALALEMARPATTPEPLPDLTVNRPSE